jgi:hypothetical protein
MDTYLDLWYLAKFLLQWQMFQTKVVEKNKTHILCSTIFFSESRALYEIMWKNMVQPEKPQLYMLDN